MRRKPAGVHVGVLDHEKRTRAPSEAIRSRDGVRTGHGRRRVGVAQRVPAQLVGAIAKRMLGGVVVMMVPKLRPRRDHSRVVPVTIL